MSQRILLVFCHPALQKSRVNRILLEAAGGLDAVTVHDLYQRYPDSFICVEEEKQRLLEHDIIVFQHPFYWYSSPSLLKEWQDLVLEYGFAYGPGASALAGKKWLSVVTAGGDEFSYTDRGVNGVSVCDLLKPFQCTAQLCRMQYLPPRVYHDVVNADNLKIARWAKDYQQYLEQLSGSGQRGGQ